MWSSYRQQDPRTELHPVWRTSSDNFDYWLEGNCCTCYLFKDTECFRMTWQRSLFWVILPICITDYLQFSISLLWCDIRRLKCLLCCFYVRCGHVMWFVKCLLLCAWRFTLRWRWGYGWLIHRVGSLVSTFASNQFQCGGLLRLWPFRQMFSVCQVMDSIWPTRLDAVLSNFQSISNVWTWKCHEPSWSSKLQTRHWDQIWILYEAFNAAQVAVYWHYHHFFDIIHV